MKPKTSLPENVLDKARAYRGATDDRAWEMADFVAEVVAECTRSRGDRTRALRQLAQHMGVSRAATSDLCQLAETYAPAVKKFDQTGKLISIVPGAREEFAETLTIGHFREAMRSKTTKPVDLLRQAILTDDEWGGQPMPVDVLRQIVRKTNAGIEPAQTPLELYKLALDRADKALSDALDYCAKPSEKKSIASMREYLSGVKA